MIKFKQALNGKHGLSSINLHCLFYGVNTIRPLPVQRRIKEMCVIVKFIFLTQVISQLLK